MKGILKAFSIAVFASMILFSMQKASACSRMFPTFKVGPDFTVVVKGRDGKPVDGIRVRIAYAEPTLEKVAEEVTDKDGRASFHKLMVSDYWISGERAGVSSTVGKLWPVNDGSGGGEITLTWPMNPVLSLQSVSGALLLGAGQLPFVGANVSLTDTISGKELGRISTDEKGRFAIRSVGPGLYVLHIEEHRDCSRYMCKIKGNILVEVDSNASDVEFPRLGLTMSSCGLAAHKDDGSLVVFE